MGPNALLALQMATQAIQLTQQIQLMFQNAVAMKRDLTDEELDTVRDGYAGVKHNVDKWLQERANREEADANAIPSDGEQPKVEG
jgi:hypothetical protein